jgi:hypothetical protein
MKNSMDERRMQRKTLKRLEALFRKTTKRDKHNTAERIRQQRTAAIAASDSVPPQARYYAHPSSDDAASANIET